MCYAPSLFESPVKYFSFIFFIFQSNVIDYSRRWSRGNKARGQGQGHKKIRGQGQGQLYRGQILSRPRTGMLEAKAKNQGYKRKCSPKKKVFRKNFQAFSRKNRFPKIFSGAPQTFNNSKNSAVLEPRTG